MNQDQALEVFRQAGAYLDGHFLLTSGRHSNAYVEKFNILQHPQHCAAVCGSIADAFRDLKPDVVVGPAVGGILLAYETARALGVRGIFLEREDGKLKLRRGFEIGPQEKVLVVEDVVTTGTSVFELLEALKTEKDEGRILGVGYLVDRSGGHGGLRGGAAARVVEAGLADLGSRLLPSVQRECAADEAGKSEGLRQGWDGPGPGVSATGPVVPCWKKLAGARVEGALRCPYADPPGPGPGLLPFLKTPKCRFRPLKPSPSVRN